MHSYKKRRGSPLQSRVEHQEHDNLLRATARLTLSSAVVLRNIRASTVRTLLVSTDSEVVAIAKQATKDWDNNRKSMGTCTVMPPYISVFVAIARYVAKQPQMEASTKMLIEQLLSTLSEKQSLDAIRVCRVSKCFDAKVTRIELDMSASFDNIGLAILNTLVSQGARPCSGPAPRSPLERELETLLSTRQVSEKRM